MGWVVTGFQENIRPSIFTNMRLLRNFESVEEVVVVWDNGTAANYR